MPILSPTPAQPQPDPTAADTGSLVDAGVLPEQPEASPDPPPPPVYNTMAESA
jgi:hypothetical protein